MEVKYRQCTLSLGKAVRTGWIPSWAAEPANLVQLKDTDDPEAFWTVLTVGSTERNESQVRVDERGYKEFQGSTRGGGID